MLCTSSRHSVSGLGYGILFSKLGEGDSCVRLQSLYFYHCTRGVVLHTVDVVSLGTVGGEGGREAGRSMKMMQGI